MSSRNWTITILLCLLLPFTGAHRFYTGHIISGVFQLFTIGGFFVWWFIDLLAIAGGSFRDAEGDRLLVHPAMSNNHAESLDVQGVRLDSVDHRVDDIAERLTRIEVALDDLRRGNESLAEDYRFLQRVLERDESVDSSTRGY